MQTTWIMATNMGESSDIGAYVQGVKDSGAKVIEVTHIPFDPELPLVEVDGPVVIYGPITFIQAILNDGRWSDGVFGDINTFTYENWAKNYGSMLLNSPDGVELTTIGQFRYDNRDPEEDIFVRPQHDTKSLVGEVLTAKKFKDWCYKVSEGGYADVSEDTPIIVAKPYGIEAEWRLFVVDNKVVGASQYKKKHKLFKQEGAPEDILAFAQKVIDTWSPVEAYTLDLCRSAGNGYIVEAQGFNSAGHYAADIKNVAKAVNEVAVKRWQQKQNKLKP